MFVELKMNCALIEFHSHLHYLDFPMLEVFNWRDATPLKKCLYHLYSGLEFYWNTLRPFQSCDPRD